MDYTILLEALPSPNGPCGEDLAFSADFDAIQEARRCDDPTLAQGEWITAVKEADWERVVRHCTSLLATRSKDLRVAAWLVEGLGRTRGLAGLADGFTLMGELCETFWDELHPRIEDGDLAERSGALHWLAVQGLRLIRELPLTDSAKGRFSWAAHESARATSRHGERQAADGEAQAGSAHLALDAFAAALKDTPATFFVDGLQQAGRLKAAILALQALLDVRMGEAAPTFAAALEVLDDIHRSHRRHAGNGSAPANGDGAVEAPALAAGAAGHPGLAAGTLQSRDQALRQLHEIAAFFRRTEPHSPVAYLADKAARWGAMPLHEWLRSVVKDDAALARVEELLGVAGLPGNAD